MNNLVFIVVLIAGVSSAPSQELPPEPDCSYKYLDYCGRDLFLWKSDLDDVRAPENEAELKEHCARQEESGKCVNDRSKNCTVSLVRGVSKLLLGAIKDEYEARCDPTTDEHKNYLKLAPCLNSVSQDLRQCSVAFIQATELATTKFAGKNFRSKVPSMCCSFSFYNACTVAAARKTCGKDGELFMYKFIEAVSGDAMGILCGSYEADSDICKSIKPVKEVVILGGKEHLGEYEGIKTLISAIAKMSDSLVN